MLYPWALAASWAWAAFSSFRAVCGLKRFVRDARGFAVPADKQTA